MKMYNKPEIFVEEFMADTPVALSCTRLNSGVTSTKIDAQQLQCADSKNWEWVFASGQTGCSHSPYYFGYIDVLGDKRDDKDTWYATASGSESVFIAAIKAADEAGTTYDVNNNSHVTEQGTVSSSGGKDNKTYTWTDGYYATWGSKDEPTNHFGYVTTTVFDLLTASY